MLSRISNKTDQLGFKNLTGLILILMVFSLEVHAQKSQKLALIVAVGEYEAGTSWKSLGSANDVDILRLALVKQGFRLEDIAVIKDEEATKTGIQKAFQEQLIDRAKPGDRVVFHFSGHGQQVADQNGDELDGFDEALVPYDSPQSFEAGKYEGERLIRDDELGEWLGALRKKIGKKGQLLVLLDACHSGTATRGYSRTRGTRQKMIAPENETAIDSGDGEGMTDLAIASKKLAPMIVISATSAQELNYEHQSHKGISYGPLSYAFSKVFPTLSKDHSYRSLFDGIRLEMAVISPRQTPQAEGQLDLQIFGGSLIPRPQYLRVERWYDEETVLIDAGIMAGIHPGTQINFYPMNTYDTTGIEPIATGTVAEALPLISEVLIESDFSKEAALSSWGFVVKKNYGDIQVGLLVNIKDKAWERKISNEIFKTPLIQRVLSDSDLILEQTDGRKLILRTRDDYVLMEENMANTEPEMVIDKYLRRIHSYSQSEFLRNLEMQNPLLQVEMELVPVTAKAVAGRYVIDERIPLEDRLSPDGKLAFAEGESFVFKITNSGRKPVYYTIIDLQSDNIIQTAIPNQECSLKAQDYYILPGQTQELSDCIIDVYPPYGNEVLKLIATEEPLDLRRIIDTRGKSSGSENPFATLFQATFPNEERGSATPSIPPSSAHIHSLTFKIVE